MTQQHQQIQQPQARGDHESRLGTLEYAVSMIVARLDGISNKLDNQGKAPWGTIITVFLGTIGTVITIVGAIGALAFSPLSSGISNVKAALVKFEGKTDSFMKREDIDARFSVLSQRRDDLQRLTDARVERVERDVETVAKQVVPREEHRAVRDLQQRDYDLLRNRIERVEGRFEKRTDGLGRGLEKLENRTVPRVELQGQLDARDRAMGTLRNEVEEHNRAFVERQQCRTDALETPPRK